MFMFISYGKSNLISTFCCCNTASLIESKATYKKAQKHNKKRTNMECLITFKHDQLKIRPYFLP